MKTLDRYEAQIMRNIKNVKMWLNFYPLIMMILGFTHQ